MELLFIRQPEKRTVMSFCGVTGRSDRFDRTLRSVQPAQQFSRDDRTMSGSGQYQPDVSGRSWMLTVIDRTLDTQGPVTTDRTRPVTLSQVWTLTGVDRTLAPSVRSHDLPASGHSRLVLLSQIN